MLPLAFHLSAGDWSKYQKIASNSVREVLPPRPRDYEDCLETYRFEENPRVELQIPLRGGKREAEMDTRLRHVPRVLLHWPLETLSLGGERLRD